MLNQKIEINHIIEYHLLNLNIKRQLSQNVTETNLFYSKYKLNI